MSNLRFELYKTLPKTKVFTVISNHGDIELGRIGWYPQWRQYVFIPFNDTIYSYDCMEEIVDKIKQLKEDRKAVAK
jgi:hypothetical protein